MRETEEPQSTWRRVRALAKGTWARNIVGLLVLGTIVGTLVAIDRALTDDSTGPLDNRHPELGEPAPLFALKDSDGGLRRLDEYRGKTVWINFWATTCGPCRRELPEIQRLADQVGSEHLVVLEVNQREGAGRAESYWKEIGLHLPILLDTDGDVSQQYRLQGLPYNFFVDAQGVLRAFKPGFLSPDEMRSNLATLGVSVSG